jgi:F-type H+-transporting ATPase subunit b
MDINLTLVGQLITFLILVWFTMKYVWPPITKTMHDREKKIAAGLEAAERSQRELEMAEHKAQTIIREARQQANQIIEQANLHSAQLVEEAKSNAKIEGQRMIELAQNDINLEISQAKEMLKTHLARLAITGAEKIIRRSLDSAAQQDLMNQLASEINAG